LARAGSEVVLPTRSDSKGHDAVERIRRELPSAKVRSEVLGLASLRSVRAFAAKINNGPKLDLLVNNAGVMSVPQRQVTQDGFELQFGTNFLGPFALTVLLMPALRRAVAPRITTVSSGATNMGLKRINFDDRQWEKSPAPWNAYCQSKLADLMSMLELERRCNAAGIRLLSNAAHPGYARTNLQTSGPGREQNMIGKVMESFMSHDAAHGASPTLRAATANDTAPGSYYGPEKLFNLKGDPVRSKLPRPAQNAEAARRLWEISEQLTGTAWSGENAAASFKA
jgi:NAD(P)-dependent dehydrogenase (short-subunit alcohol dehydrogenase family)